MILKVYGKRYIYHDGNKGNEKPGSLLHELAEKVFSIKKILMRNKKQVILV